MRPDPVPMEIAVNLLAQRATVRANADAPVFSNFLEMKRRVARIAFQQREILVRKRADIWRQTPVAFPEFSACEVAHFMNALPTQTDRSSRGMRHPPLRAIRS